MAKKKQAESTMAVYRYRMDCGRMGYVSGIFVATDDDVKASLGKTVHFGEVLGKHSDVSGTLEASEFERLTDDADFIAKFNKWGLSNGYNPLDYLDEDGEDSDEDEGGP